MSVISLMTGSSLSAFAGELVSAVQSPNILKVFGAAIVGVAVAFEMYNCYQGQSLVGRVYDYCTAPMSESTKDFLTTFILLILLLLACIVWPFSK